MQTIQILGATGYFGAHFTTYFQEKDWKVITERVDIRDLSAIKASLEKNKPDVVLNCIGKTGKPNVDWCESHKEETMQVNVAGAISVASAASELNIYCAYIGSGCIYEGDNEGRGHLETDPANFYGSFYSRTKILAEKALSEFPVLQLRVRIPIEGKPQSKNVIDKLLHYEKIISVENSFTIVEDFLPAAYELITRKETGIFNMTNQGSMDHEYLMGKYTEIVDPNKNFQVMTLKELSKITAAPRSNCVLNTGKLKNLGITMPPIKGRIIEIMQTYKENQIPHLSEESEKVAVEGYKEINQLKKQGKFKGHSAEEIMNQIF